MVKAGASSTEPLRFVPGKVVRIATPPDPDAIPVAPTPLTSEAIAEIAAHTLGHPAPPGMVRQVADVTAGMPWLVELLMPAIHLGDRATVPDPLIPPEVIDRLGYELETAQEDLKELLLALAVGFDLSDHLPVTVGQADGSINTLVEQARTAGLILASGHLVPLVGQAMLKATPPYRVRALQRMLLEDFVGEGLPLDAIAERLARDGLKDLRIAATLERAADSALAAEPARARALFQLAIAAGSDEPSTAARRAQAAAAAGDLNGAVRIVDSLLAHEDPPDLARAIDVAAAAWARRGMLAYGADLYRWRGPEKIGSSAGLAVVAMLGSGDLAGAESMAQVAPSAGDRPCMGNSAVATLMGQGVRHSVCGHPAQALSSLIQASDMMTASGITTPLPESPAALATLAALHSGDLDLADSLLNAAIAGGQGGPAARPRLLMLRAWVAMQRDRPEFARAAISAATQSELVPRDMLWLQALEVGLARRADDVPSLVRAWHRARESVLHVDVDLYNLMPLAELVVAATRLREAERLEPQLADAWNLLERLGDPPLWSVPLHWAAVQAAILAERPHDLAPHAAALVRASGHDHLAATLATAGRAWVSVLAGQFDVSAVEAAARNLAVVGMTWDGARLAGHAAARAPERKDMARLLACARGLRPSAAQAPEPVGDRGPFATPGFRVPAERDPSTLSAREREVAILVLEGKTYQEIGEAIFVSPRTVEHHIASIRRRLGVTSRAELLGKLRLLLDERGPVSE